jgi:hypothetical protein
MFSQVMKTDDKIGWKNIAGKISIYLTATFVPAIVPFLSSPARASSKNSNYLLGVIKSLFYVATLRRTKGLIS